MKILAVGNSFSQDATTFIHQAARAQGLEVKVVNLYIGGCPLERHWANVESGEAAYEYQLNGVFTGRMAGLEEVLSEENWDVIVTHQASHDSGWMDSYEPFLGRLLEVFRRHAPGAVLALQETWAYEADSDHPRFIRYNRDQKEMYDRLRFCYRTMARRYGLPLLPSGDVIQQLRAMPPFHVPSGGRKLTRDGFHMSLSYGRYLLACVWLNKLCGLKAVENSFVPNGEEAVEEELLALIRATVDDVLEKEEKSHA